MLKMDSNKPVKVVYIMGSGRSGSTLLNRILNEHPNIIGVGELSHFADPFINQTKCSCGTLTPTCPFWSQVRQGWYQKTATHNSKDYLSLQCYFEQYSNPYHHKSSRFESLKRLVIGFSRLLQEQHKSTRDFRQYTEQTQTLFEQIRTISGKDIIVDASKSPRRAFALSLMDGIELYVIHLVRDGRGVAWSYKKHIHNKKIKAGWDMKPIPVWKSSQKWVRINLLSNWIRQKVSQEKTLFCRYEDMIQHPQETLANIGTFIKQDFTNIVQKLLTEQPIPTGHTLAGNVMRMSPIVKLNLDNAWVGRLSPKELLAFYILAGWLNRQYGYQ